MNTLHLKTDLTSVTLAVGHLETAMLGYSACTQSGRVEDRLIGGTILYAAIRNAFRELGVPLHPDPVEAEKRSAFYEESDSEQ